MLRVYVAGAYSSNNIISCLENMRRGIKTSLKVLSSGMAPFVPWLDYHFTLMRESGQEITLEMYYDYSMAWLEGSNCVFVSHGHKTSSGTQSEINRAEEIGIPVFYNFDDLLKFKTEITEW